MSKPMTALELRDSRRANAAADKAARVERTEERTVLVINGAYVAINNSRLDDFTQVLDQSGVKYDRVNQGLWKAINGYEYEAVNKAIEEHCEENRIEMHYEFMDNYRYAIVGDEDSEKQYEVCQMKGCCGSYEEVITVDTSSHYQNSSIEIRFGFNYGH